MYEINLQQMEKRLRDNNGEHRDAARRYPRGIE